MKIELVIPMTLPSVANLREHWAVKAKRTKAQREAVLWNRGLFILIAPGDIITVNLTRLAPRSLDLDNLQSSFKAVRDGVADALGIKDNDSRVTWIYRQAPSKEPMIKIEVEYARIA